ncbi:hypothetical protein GCM10010206_17280 [Streptomyces cinerochromogenes]|nr:hypothetical protein GCM10010206_17280 [Streptomyces cinerochromogenes]
MDGSGRAAVVRLPSMPGDTDARIGDPRPDAAPAVRAAAGLAVVADPNTPDPLGCQGYAQ